MTKLKLVLLLSLTLAFSCKQKETSFEATDAQLRALTESDSIPIRLMPDTIKISKEKPLIFFDRASSDSVTLFPYSLIFEESTYDVYLVSFADFSPTLITLDKNKTIIDSVTLMLKNSRSRVSIASPMDIVVIDSARQTETANAIKVRKYQVNADGKIKLL